MILNIKYKLHIKFFAAIEFTRNTVSPSTTCNVQFDKTLLVPKGWYVSMMHQASSVQHNGTLLEDVAMFSSWMNSADNLERRLPLSISSERC